jgi:hypothetical protein
MVDQQIQQLLQEKLRTKLHELEEQVSDNETAH